MTVYDEKPWLKFFDPDVPHEIEIPDVTYSELLEQGLTFNPDKPAYHYMGTTGTFKDLDDYSKSFAAFLVKKGCKPGDTVGINLPNTPQFLIAVAGVIRAGCVVSGISPLLTPKELIHQLNDSGVKVIVTLDDLYSLVLSQVCEHIPALQDIVITNMGDFLSSGNLEPAADKSIHYFRQVITGYPAEKPSVSRTPDDTCLLPYTGGTTGVSKGTVITHRNIVANITQVMTWFDYKIGEGVTCSGLPMFHIAGLFVSLCSMYIGQTQCIIPDPRDIKNICREIEEHKPMYLGNVPTLYQMLQEDPDFRKLDLSHCKACSSGAAPFSVEGIREFESLVGEGKVVELFGLTETSPMLTANPLKGKRKIGSVGVPLPNTMVKIVDVKTGKNEMPVGEPGEMIVQGPQVMKEYINSPGETQNALRELNGEIWLYTGDVARMDEDGYFYIVDRTKDMILVGGYNVYSRQVEETLYEHPAVELCAVVGVENPERIGTEIVKAFIQLKADHKNDNLKGLEEDIIAQCKKDLAPYKIPKIIEFVGAVPLSAVGKVDKKVLR